MDSIVSMLRAIDCENLSSRFRLDCDKDIVSFFFIIIVINFFSFFFDRDEPRFVNLFET